MTMSLEELESRCDSLQRRVAERTPTPSTNGGGGARRSPQRPSRFPAGYERASSPPAARARHLDVSGPVSPHPVRGRDQLDAPQQPGLSASDIGFAVSALEREKSKLEEQLRLVNLHLAAYRQLQDRPAAMSTNSNATPSSALWQAHVASGRPAAMTPTPTQMQRPSSAAPVTTTSPTRRRSPPRATVQTEQIYEELRQIRRAREEREAQRRAAAGAASPPRM
jgi:hypothetical protein